MFEKTEIKIIGLVDNMSFLGVMTEKIIKFLVKVELKKQQKNLIKFFRSLAFTSRFKKFC